MKAVAEAEQQFDAAVNNDLLAPAAVTLQPLLPLLPAWEASSPSA